MGEKPEKKENRASSEKSAGAANAPRRSIWIRFIRLQRRLARKRKAEREKEKAGESKADRAARSTARATWWIAFFTVILALVGGFTLVEVISGGTDTHNLAVAAGNQATWTQRLKTSTDTESDYMKDLANHMKDQADQTKVLAHQAKVQANEATVAADAAKSAAETAKDALHISERAYLTFGSPINNFQNGRMEIPILNSGHVPSGSVKVVEHEATFQGITFNGQPIPLSSIVESHWTKSAYQSVPVVQNGSIFSVEILFPKLNQTDLNAGKQAILTVVVMTYNDGFKGTPEQSWTFCDYSSFDAEKKILTMRPCSDAGPALRMLLSIDHYPDAKYELK